MNALTLPDALIDRLADKWKTSPVLRTFMATWMMMGHRPSKEEIADAIEVDKELDGIIV